MFPYKEPKRHAEGDHVEIEAKTGIYKSMKQGYQKVEGNADMQIGFVSQSP